MPRTFIQTGGRVVAVAIAALAAAFDYTGESITGIDDVNAVVAVAGAVFVVLTIWREFDLHTHPRPRVEYSGLSPRTRPVERRHQDALGNWTVETKQGTFQRIRVQNRAVEPSGETSVARHLSARIALYRMNGTTVDEWIGRWSDLREAENVGDKWELDRIDLPPNGQEATLDIGVSYAGERGFFRWDNSRYIGDYNAKRWEDKKYKVEVSLRANNMAQRQYVFSLINEVDDVKLIPLDHEPDRSRPSRLAILLEWARLGRAHGMGPDARPEELTDEPDESGDDSPFAARSDQPAADAHTREPGCDDLESSFELTPQVAPKGWVHLLLRNFAKVGDFHVDLTRIEGVTSDETTPIPVKWRGHTGEDRRVIREAPIDLAQVSFPWYDEPGSGVIFVSPRGRRVGNWKGAISRCIASLNPTVGSLRPTPSPHPMECRWNWVYFLMKSLCTYERHALTQERRSFGS